MRADIFTDEMERNFECKSNKIYVKSRGLIN
jgi:hypothetical protein